MGKTHGAGWWVVVMGLIGCGSGLPRSSAGDARSEDQRGGSDGAADGAPAGEDGGSGGGGGGGGGVDGAAGGGDRDAAAEARDAGAAGDADGAPGADANPEMCAGGICDDFPAAPIFDNLPPSAADSFTGAAPTPTGGPCINEPENLTMFPNNWLRPRVAFSFSYGRVVQLRITAANQANPLIVYTTGPTWTLPQDIWVRLRRHQLDNELVVRVWTQGLGANEAHFRIAPVGVQGNITFLSANPAFAGVDPHSCRTNITPCVNAAELRALVPGLETSMVVLAVDQVAQQSRADDGTASHVTCVGCHSVTPDGQFVSLTDGYPWRAALASLQSGVVGSTYPSLTPAGLAALQQPGWGRFSYAQGVGKATLWLPGRKIGVASLGHRAPFNPDYSNAPDQNDSPGLAWVNLEASNARAPQPNDNSNWSYPSFGPGAGVDSGNALGLIQRTGDPYGAATPAFSHDGSDIVYASTNAAISGHLNQEVPSPGPTGDPTTSGITQNSNAQRVPGLTKLYRVPFNGGLGGQAAPLPGADLPRTEEYAPDYSPDDELVVFSAVPIGQSMYANPNSEIAIVKGRGVPSSGRIRLLANDVTSCSSKSSPGINNHAARWAPLAETVDGRTYYWLVFSSNRADIPPQVVGGRAYPMSQIYLTLVVVSSFGYETYPAIHIWDQPADRINTTPEWDSYGVDPPP